MSFFSNTKCNSLFHRFTCRFQNEVIGNDSYYADSYTQQLIVGECVTAEEQHKQYNKWQHIGQYHRLVACRGFQQQLHGLPYLVLLLSGIFHGDDLLPAVRGDADALGVAAAACGAHDDFHADVVAIDGANDAFSADVVFFVHICSFVLVSPTLRFACVGLLALRASCPFGAAQGIMFQYNVAFSTQLLTTNY